MASTQHPEAITPAKPLAARSQGYRIESSPPIEADAIDDILGSCLIWILPALFLAGIIVLGTMLISNTIVMRIPLPRLFALIIVIFFAVLITITFFLLMAFHFRRCQRRIPFKRVRFTLSETSSVAGKGVPGSGSLSHNSEFSQISLSNVGAAVVPTSEPSRSLSHRSEFSQISLLNVGAAVGPTSEPAFAQDISAIPLRRVKCHANIKQAAQDQDSNKAPVVVPRESTGPLHDSARVLPPSSHSSLENNTISENQWPLRLSSLQRPLPLSIPPPPSGDTQSKEEAVYYLAPGPPSSLPRAGIRPILVDDIESQIQVHEASETGKHRKWWST